MTIYAPMPEQPILEKVCGHVSQNEGDGYRWKLSPFEMTPPHQPGDRVGQREPTWYRDYDRVTVYDDCKFRVGDDPKLRNGRMRGKDAVWLPKDADQMLAWKFVRVPADTMPAWAIRTYLDCLSCVPVLANQLTEADCLAILKCTYATCPIHKAPERSLRQVLEEKYGIDAWTSWGWLTTFKQPP